MVCRICFKGKDFLSINCTNQVFFLFYDDNFVRDVSFRNGRAAESCKNDEMGFVECLKIILR